MIDLREAEGRTAAEVMHPYVSTLPPTATVGAVREYLAPSSTTTTTLLGIIAINVARSYFCGT